MIYPIVRYEQSYDNYMVIRRISIYGLADYRRRNSTVQWQDRHSYALLPISLNDCVMVIDFGMYSMISSSIIWFLRYENDGVFTKLQLQQIRKSSLSRVLCDNGDDIDRVQHDVFTYASHHNQSSFYASCDDIPSINLNMWQSCCDTDAHMCTSNQHHASTNDDNNNRRRRRDSSSLMRHMNDDDHYAKKECVDNDHVYIDGFQWTRNDNSRCQCEVSNILRFILIIRFIPEWPNLVHWINDRTKLDQKHIEWNVVLIDEW